MTRGIILLALGHPYYGRMAHNLAVAIKHIEPTMPVAVVYEGKSLSYLGSYDLKNTFNHIIEAPICSYTTQQGKRSYFKTKLWMYDLSPFDETIYLDCDMMWLMRKPSELFQSLSPYGFSAISEGYYDMASGENKINPQYQLWAKLEEIMQAYFDDENFRKGKLYQFRSEFMYFKKSEKNRKFFDTAKHVFENPKIPVTAIGGSVTDEFALNIACCLTHHYPHKDNYCPVYWYFMNTGQWNDKRAMYNNYYAISMGGNRQPSYVKQFYNSLASARFQQAGIKYPFKLQDKRTWLPERKSI